MCIWRTLFADKTELQELTEVRIGNKYIVKNEERIQSDAEIYLDNDCIMLPVRTFFTSVNKNTRINWDEENKNASVLIGEYHILLNAEKRN